MITVIIPAYNAQEYLRECLESVLAQTFKEWECVIVNDGSTDGTAAIAGEYVSLDRRFRLVSKSNGGLADARNCGLDHTDSEWVTFLDADDCLYPRALESMHACALSTGADIVVGEIIYGLSFEPKHVRPKSGLIEMTGLEAAEAMLYQRFGCDASACGKLIRSTLTDRCRFTPGLMYEDLECMSRMYLVTPRVVRNGVPVYFYRDNSSSFIHTFSPRRLDALRVTRMIVERAASTHRELLPAALDRQLSASFNIYGLLARYAPESKDEMSYCWDVIRANRRASLFNRNVRLKNKAGIILSYLGPGLLRHVMRAATR